MRPASMSLLGGVRAKPSERNVTWLPLAVARLLLGRICTFAGSVLWRTSLSVPVL